MPTQPPIFRRRLVLLAVLLAGTAVTPAFATDPVPVTPPPPAAAPVATDGAAPRVPRSQNVTINLINRLVARGLLPQSDADELIKEAEEDAAEARAEAAHPMAGPAAAPGSVATAPAATPGPPAGPAPAPEGTVRVTYVPEIVKDQLRDEIKAEVMAEARAEHWAGPDAVPDWVSRYRFNGDIRVREEGDLYPSGNDDSGAFTNFNAINTGAPFDLLGNELPPQLNVNQDRERPRLRARFGTAVDLDEGFTSGFRLATGNDNQPVSENQTIGGANSGQGGNFSKYAIWLDRGFIRYDSGGTDQNFSVSVGRFDNPFFATTMIWANDLGFDGLVMQAHSQFTDDFTPFFTLGIFPVFNTDLNFATIQPAKFKSTDKWLDAIQAGADWKVDKDISLKFAVAFYDFENIEGRLSTPFTPLTSADQGNTDDTRPSFAQTGNTYMALRDIAPSPLNDNGTIDDFQYFGLSTPFRELALTARLDFARYDPFHVSLTGEIVENIAFNRADVAAIAVNNFGAGAPGSYEGGDLAWITTLKVGAAALEKRWDWNVSLGYRSVGSDSVVDGFCDADFGGGGTNVQGYTFGGSLALSARTWLTLIWMSSDAIAGPPLKEDILQFDLNAKF